MGTLQDLIPEAALAADLKKSVRTLQIWRQRRIGPTPTKIGKDVYYSRRAVEVWLAALEKRNVVRGRAA